jgi:hypothetical protein
MPTKGLKKFLKTLTKEELIDHITELDKKYKPVQEYHQVYLASDLTDFIEKQKKIIPMKISNKNVPHHANNRNALQLLPGMPPQIMALCQWYQYGTLQRPGL